MKKFIDEFANLYKSSLRGTYLHHCCSSCDSAACWHGHVHQPPEIHFPALGGTHNIGSTGHDNTDQGIQLPWQLQNLQKRNLPRSINNINQITISFWKTLKYEYQNCIQASFYHVLMLSLTISASYPILVNSVSRAVSHWPPWFVQHGWGVRTGIGGWGIPSRVAVCSLPLSHDCCCNTLAESETVYLVQHWIVWYSKI